MSTLHSTSRRACAAALGAALLLASAACDSGTGGDSNGGEGAKASAAAVAWFPHTDDIEVAVADSGQGFDPVSSFVALAALADEADTVLADIDYQANHATWDPYLEPQYLRSEDSMNVAVVVEAATVVHRNTGGSFLTPAQVDAVAGYLQWAVAEDGYIDTPVAQRGIVTAARNLDVALEREPDQLPLEYLSDAATHCDPEYWIAEAWQVSTAVVVQGREPCTEAQLGQIWNALLAELDARLADGPVELAASELVGLLNLLLNRYQQALPSDAAASLASGVARLHAQLGSDGWVWLWSYYDLQRDHLRPTVGPDISQGAREVLAHFVVHGLPDIELRDTA